VQYPGAIYDEQLEQWISNAEVAEIPYTAFETSRHKVTARLIVRRVKELNPAPAGQQELFPIWRYHAFLTDTNLSTVEADQTHRDHAVIEQVFADLIDGPLAHLPSGRFAANAAWLTLAAMAHNLLRAAGCLTGPRYARARAATIRRQLINVPARIAPSPTRPAAPAGTLAVATPLAGPLRQRPRPTPAGPQPLIRPARQRPTTLRRTPERPANHAHPTTKTSTNVDGSSRYQKPHQSIGGSRLRTRVVALLPWQRRTRMDLHQREDTTMAGRKGTGGGGAAKAARGLGRHDAGAGRPARLTRHIYERELFGLQAELVKLQEWVRVEGARLVVIFEGRDAAGKGSAIKRISEYLNPRVARIAALPAPTERERSQWYFQRYVEHLPAAGEIVLFDRSWYNRAGVDWVMGFCTETEYQRFLHQCPIFERLLVEDGTMLRKYWFSVSDAQQERRFRARLNDPMRRWKLSAMDLESIARWEDYSRAKDEMFARTDRPETPWYDVDSDDKRRARINMIAHLLTTVPYYEVQRPPLQLPPRPASSGYRRPPPEITNYVPDYAASLPDGA
jgi:polyphosphate kinase 2